MHNIIIFFKLLRKFGVGSFYLRLLSPFIRFDDKLPDYNSAMEMLNSLSLNPANSCICNKQEKETSSGFSLDKIVPSYNSEKTIEKCILSVLNQKSSYSFRLIIIDDGATDSSPSKIDQFAGDPRVCIVHQENKGFSGARNTGLQISNAEYIMFLDSDDTLCPGAIEGLMQLANSGYAIVEGAFNTVDLNGKVLTSGVHKSGKINPRHDMTGYFWAKVFKSELFDGLCLPMDYWYEDSLMAQIIYPLADIRRYTASGYRKAVYNYTVNPSGISASGRKSLKCIDSLWITLQLYKDRCSLDLNTDQQYFEYILNMLCLTYIRCEILSNDAKLAMFVIWKDFIEKNFSEFHSTIPCHEILLNAVRNGNFTLYSLACRLIS